MRFLLLLLLGISLAECRTCECSQSSAHATNGTYDSQCVEWINDFLKDLYEMKSDTIYQSLVHTIDTEVWS